MLDIFPKFSIVGSSGCHFFSIGAIVKDMDRIVSRFQFAIVTAYLVACANILVLPDAYSNDAPKSQDSSASKDNNIQWFNRKPKQIQINLYFFWSLSCPHCLEARPVVQGLSKKYPWIKLHSFELTGSTQNARLYQKMASKLKQEATSVPAILFCGIMQVGFDSADPEGLQLLSQLKKCRKILVSGKPISDFQKKYQLENTPQVNIPLIGTLDLKQYSLTITTIILAAMDAFNPCAFFVLLFLLSMLVHARSRAKILLVGGIFVLISGLMYFLFMSAWLNIFMFIGQIVWITLIAGIVALIIAIINIKDYFWFKQGISLTIPTAAKSGLFQRMHGLLDSRRMTTMVGGAIILAVFANLYEFLCTVGFPMVFTRILTMEPISVSQYYAYLVLYNLIYILPLATIVIVFAITLGRRKLQEHEGRIMKLLSGLMMLFLGSILIFAPQMLNQMLTAFVLLVLAIISTWLIVKINQWHNSSRH